MTGHTGTRWNNWWWFTSEKCGTKGLELISQSHLSTGKCSLYYNKNLSAHQCNNVTWVVSVPPVQMSLQCTQLQVKHELQAMSWTWPIPKLQCGRRRAGLVTVQTSSTPAYLSKHRMWRKGPLRHIGALITHQDYNALFLNNVTLDTTPTKL